MQIKKYEVVTEESVWSLDESDEQPTYEQTTSVSPTESWGDKEGAKPRWEVTIPSEDWETTFPASKEDFKETLQRRCESAVFEGLLSEMPPELDDPKYLHPVVTDLEYQINETVRPKMENANLTPDDVEVYTDSGELWLQVWLVDGSNLQERKEQAMEMIKEFIAEYDHLPSTVNTNYQIGSDESPISVWWN